MSASFPRPTHYTARCVNGTAGIEQMIKEFPIGIQG